MPIRIQRKRVKGWKMPPNTINVTRPGQFGNPFVVGGWYKLGLGSNKSSFTWFRCLDEKIAIKEGYTKIETKQDAVEWFKTYRERYPLHQSEKDKLKDKDLACWCKIGEPCHAEILLEIANS